MISNQQVLQKMLQEVQAALATSDQPVEVKTHAQAIRLLCELILDTEEAKPNVATSKLPQHDASNEIELRKMMGDLPNPSPKPSKKLEEEEGNGDSIFDF